MKNEKKLSLVLMIISAIIVFFIGNLLGVILAIISLIISIKNLKKREKLNTIALVGSIIIIVFSVLAFFATLNVVNKTLDRAKQQALKNQEEFIETHSEVYKDKMIQDGTLVNGKNILDEEMLKKYNITCPSECECYVIANIDISNQSNDLFKAYLKCNNYQTAGYEKK